jgi:hypothetical protein
MSRREELAEKLLRILICLSHDPLLHEPDFPRDIGDHLGFTPRDGGDDGVREAERRGWVQPAVVQTCRNGLGLSQSRLQGDLGTQWPVYGHQEVFANELIQLERATAAAPISAHDDDECSGDRRGHGGCDCGFGFH